MYGGGGSNARLAFRKRMAEQAAFNARYQAAKNTKAAANVKAAANALAIANANAKKAANLATVSSLKSAVAAAARNASTKSRNISNTISAKFNALANQANSINQATGGKRRTRRRRTHRRRN